MGRDKQRNEIVIQRVKQAPGVDWKPSTQQNFTSGLLLLVGVRPDDGQMTWIMLFVKNRSYADFSDDEGKMNLSVKDIEGRFFLFLNSPTRIPKRNQPAFVKERHHPNASRLYDELNQLLAYEVPAKTDLFGADMQVELINDGPVTIILDTKNWGQIWKGVWTLMFKLLILLL